MIKAVEISAETPKKSEETIDGPCYDISNFELIRILNNNTVRKSIALLGKFPDQSQTNLAIVHFEKEAFTDNDVQTKSSTGGSSKDLNETDDVELNKTKSVPSYFSKELKVYTEFINNIYGSFKCVPSSDLNGVKTTVVYPALEKHIEKYSVCQKYLINETPVLYENITLPYIKSSQFSLEWVYNILEHKKETERIIYEDSSSETGFVLLPDLKWDGRNPETLYLLAITHQREIKSLRDLTADHLPLLRNIRSQAGEVIERKYGILTTQLRMYFHYQPSFYHLHVHINPIRNDAPGIWCEKSHMLNTVINNLELMPEYYQLATLPFILYDSNKLLEKYEEEFVIRKRVKSSNDIGAEKTSDD